MVLKKDGNFIKKEEISIKKIFESIMNFFTNFRIRTSDLHFDSISEISERL